ncbi:S41 family peptidase [Chitinophaga silvisoli]|uniref:Peptidase S41 n=1 Tax=Chitinophaga silvisoli TaxID=2291814 RepID=A0A3E1NU24_9BACT|nr:S41 family peptidase [Chitinophaga silvisoli]RFM31420.1 peptidase S41 [Chitinophaga silvisoli]
MPTFAAMKNVLIILLFLQQGLSAQPIKKDSLHTYNKTLTPGQMKSDLQTFFDIRKAVNSGLYRYRTPKQIDSIYKWAFREIKKPMSTLDFFHIILQLTDFEGSCHNYTEPDAELVGYLNRQKAFFPYAIKYIEGKMIFNTVGAAIPVGSEILSINGVPEQQLMQSFYKYCTADGFTITEKQSSSVDKSYGIRYLYEYGVNDSFKISYRAPGTTTTQTITAAAITNDERNAVFAARYSAPVDSITDWRVQPSYSFKMLNPNTGLFNFRIFNMADDDTDPRFAGYVKYLDSVFQLLAKNNVPNLIIDLRGNPGGSDPTFEQPVMYLTDSNFKENTLAYSIFGKEVPFEQYFYGISTSHRMDSAEKEEGKKMLYDYFPKLVNGKNIQNPRYNPVYHPKSPGYKGKLYMLIDERVASAGSHMASLVKAYARNVTVVGVETTGGYYYHNGHMPMVYELPNSKIKSKFSFVHVEQDAVVKPDQPEGRGIIPDYTVWPSYADFMQNRDTQMEYVLKLINK